MKATIAQLPLIDSGTALILQDQPLILFPFNTDRDYTIRFSFELTEDVSKVGFSMGSNPEKTGSTMNVVASIHKRHFTNSAPMIFASDGNRDFAMNCGIHTHGNEDQHAFTVTYTIYELQRHGDHS